MNREPRLPAKIGILVVDDHAVVVQGLVSFLQDEPDFNVLGSAPGPAAAIAAIAEKQPDVIVTDISLENGNGIALVRDVKSQWPRIRSIVLSMHDERMYAERALRAGARGYVMKDRPLDEIANAIRAAARGKLAFGETVKDRLLHQAANGGISPLNAGDALSERELEVLELAAKGYRPRQIAEILHIGTGTVNTHCKRIRQKLGIEGMDGLIRFAADWYSNRGRP